MPPTVNSYYQYARAFQDAQERWYLEVMTPFRFTDEQDNVPHQVRAGETLFILAYRYYRSFENPTRMWKAIADFNDIVDPTLPLEEGKILIIPSERWIRDVFLAPTPEYQAVVAGVGEFS